MDMDAQTYGTLREDLCLEIGGHNEHLMLPTPIKLQFVLSSKAASFCTRQSLVNM